MHSKISFCFFRTCIISFVKDSQYFTDQIYGLLLAEMHRCISRIQGVQAILLVFFYICFQASGENAIAVSGRGTRSNDKLGTNAANAVAIKVNNNGNATNPDVQERSLYGGGLAVFEKIPAGTYFLVETSAPKLYPTDSSANAPVWQTVEEKYRLVVDGKGFYTISVATKGTDGNAVWTDVNDAPTTRFVKDTSGKYKASTTSITDTTTDDLVNVYTVMNVSLIERKVILRKVAQSTNDPLGGARFRIFRADMTEVVNGDYVETTGREGYVSYASGVYFIDTLPEGKYYLVECAAPTGYSANAGKVFTLEVKDGMAKQVETTQTIDLSGSVDVVTALRNLLGK